MNITEFLHKNKENFAQFYTFLSNFLVNFTHFYIFRRFFPKGYDFSKVTDDEVAYAVNWMNSYPRQIHGGKTPVMIFKNAALSDRKVGN